MFKSLLTASVFSAVLCMASVSANAQSAADPSADQIYQAASHGHVREAEQMVEQVLRDHPGSAKAHYVAAEVYGKAGDVSRARTELSTAEHLKPGLPFANPTAVTALKTELYGRTAVPNPVTRETSRPFAFPWGLSALIVLAVVVIWAVMRRRREAEYRYAAQLPAAAGGPQYGPTYGPTPGVGPVMGGGGLGSGIAGGLASGLAVGAGVVAGEELARHFLDRDQHGAVIPPEHESLTQAGPDINSDMGGNDFGLDSQDASSWDDNSSSWDDGSFGDDGGGGDWS